MAKPTMPVSSDARLNPELAQELGELRGQMMTAAVQWPIPRRFQTRPFAILPAVSIDDTLTGMTTLVPLHAYGAVRAVLFDLFGDPDLMTDEEISAFLRGLSDALGRKWKSKLLDAWLSGRDTQWGWQARWIRNHRGPTWLNKFRFPPRPEPQGK